jgi:nucleoid-associated protein YgaU
MAGIDQTVVLGLAGKVDQVFAKPQAYYAFPTSPIGFSADNLRLITADPLSADGVRAHAAFSILVNEIPDGPVWQPDSGLLWDTYGDVLSSSMVELLERQPDKAAKRAYDKAYALLYDDGPDGLPVASQPVVAYERYRDAYLAASFEYNNRKGEAELSDDEAVKTAWAKDEPGLLAAVEDAEVDWEGPGKRDEVDAARRVISDYGSDSPSTVWEGFRKLFNPSMPEVFFRSTTENLLYVPTGYLPADVVDVGWSTITVTAHELKQLAKQAPEELRDRLEGGADAGIERVSFEYTLATVSRSWYTPDAFESDAWKFRDPTRVLSDGESPPDGECTAYVTGLVLARNIEVQRRKAAGAGKLQQELGFLPAMKAQRYKGSKRYTVDRLKSRIAARSVKSGSKMTVSQRLLATKPAGVWNLSGNSKAAAVASSRALSAAKLTSLRADVRTLYVPPKRPSKPKDPGRTTTQKTDPSEVFVLALQCKLLPKSPGVQSPGSATSDEPKEYTVAKGDTLAKISQRFYGDGKKWQRIYEANRKVIGKDPALIKPGQKLVIP